MRLKGVRITEFKSIWDSTKFEVGKITCLVGKNEAGKTAVLQALYRLNPIVPDEGEFDVTFDYPKVEVEDYEQAIEAGEREEAEVVEATFELDDHERSEIAKLYGEGALSEPTITLFKGYERGADGTCTRRVRVPTNEPAIARHLLQLFAVPAEVAQHCEPHLEKLAALDHCLERLAEENAAKAKALRESAATATTEEEKALAVSKAGDLGEGEQVKALRARLAEIKAARGVGLHIWSKILKPRLPKFLYFDTYYQMVGQANINALKQRLQSGALEQADHPLLGLIELARLDLDKLLAAKSTQELKNKLQGASNHLTKQILRYWSQNKHLRMAFDVRHGLPEDPEGMTSGVNIWGEVEDQKHLVSTGLGTRSAGFVWFFSFLAWYSAEKKKRQPLVLLLDEPGLTLHGKAQADLLRYFDDEIASEEKHQLIYTTHSPFMVDPTSFDRVRIVQDKSIDTDEELPREEDGTKVFTDVLKAGPDSLFPLQGALGYEVHQTLFVGPNCLLVEGVSDLLYLQTMSAVLSSQGREGLNEDWTITPVGGAGKVPTFVSLVGSQKDLRVATLIDYQKSDDQLIEDLYKKKLIQKSRVLTYADFTSGSEADVEDMFDLGYYLRLVNEEFGVKIKVSDLKSKAPRVVVRLKKFFDDNPLPNGQSYNHYRPARLLSERSSKWKIPSGTLDRFEDAFKRLNGLLR